VPKEEGEEPSREDLFRIPGPNDVALPGLTLA
jgi:hypothetical protein